MKIKINVDPKKVFADCNECLLSLGYTFAGTVTGKTVKPIYELEGNRFSVQKCVIERYVVKTLILETFTGQTDQEKAPAPEPEPGEPEA